MSSALECLLRDELSEATNRIGELVRQLSAAEDTVVNRDSTIAELEEKITALEEFKAEALDALDDISRSVKRVV